MKKLTLLLLLCAGQISTNCAQTTTTSTEDNIKKLHLQFLNHLNSFSLTLKNYLNSLINESQLSWYEKKLLKLMMDKQIDLIAQMTLTNINSYKKSLNEILTELRKSSANTSTMINKK